MKQSLSFFLKKRFLEFVLLRPNWKSFSIVQHNYELFQGLFFSVFAVSSGSEIIENKEVSSANNMIFDFRLLS